MLIRSFYLYRVIPNSLYSVEHSLLFDDGCFVVQSDRVKIFSFFFPPLVIQQLKRLLT